MENVSAQKGEVSAQLNEKRSQLSALRQAILEEEDKLQSSVSQIHKQKCGEMSAEHWDLTDPSSPSDADLPFLLSELKHVVEMQQLEGNELQGLQVQHEQKIRDLEETQSLLLQVRCCSIACHGGMWGAGNAD